MHYLLSSLQLHENANVAGPQLLRFDNHLLYCSGFLLYRCAGVLRIQRMIQAEFILFQWTIFTDFCIHEYLCPAHLYAGVHWYTCKLSWKGLLKVSSCILAVACVYPGAHISMAGFHSNIIHEDFTTWMTLDACVEILHLVQRRSHMCPCSLKIQLFRVVALTILLPSRTSVFLNIGHDLRRRITIDLLCLSAILCPSLFDHVWCRLGHGHRYRSDTGK